MHLTRAAFHRVYDPAHVCSALEKEPSNESLRALYVVMQDGGGDRFIISPTSTEIFDGIEKSCPNFSQVIKNLRQWAALEMAGSGGAEFTPLLLLGEPGIGKTHFAKKLAKAIETGFEFISMASLTAGWILSGASPQWSGAKPGKVARALIYGDFANPVVLLDEIDKAGGDHRYDPFGALYTLLERDTSQHFGDEFIEGVPLDASRILWVATANDERGIPEPIRNRMEIFEVRKPSREEARAIAKRLYEEMISGHSWGFNQEAPDDTLDCLADLPPRDMQRILLSALGEAKVQGRNRLLPEDIRVVQKRRGSRRSIGFSY